MYGRVGKGVFSHSPHIIPHARQKIKGQIMLLLDDGSPDRAKVKELYGGEQ
jgi:hypothetical protein